MQIFKNSDLRRAFSWKVLAISILLVYVYYISPLYLRIMNRYLRIFVLHVDGIMDFLTNGIVLSYNTTKIRVS